MNWPKIKTALIFMFLVIDLFLFVWNISLQKDSLSVDKNTVENTKKLLYDRGIMISDGLIDLEIPEIGSVIVRNSMANQAEFIGNILGGGYIKEGNVFYKDNRSVTINGNKFVITQEGEVDSLDEAEKWLSAMGFNLEDTVRTEYKGGYVFRTVHKGFEVFKSRILVENKDGELKAEGSLFYIIEDKEKKGENVHVSSVLPKLIKEGVGGQRITSITTGYLPVIEEGVFSEADAVASYRILLSDGREFFYSASK